MKRGFLVIAIITVALVVGLAAVRFSPWLRTVVNYCSQGSVELGTQRLIPCPPRNLPQPTFLAGGECADGKDNDSDSRIDSRDPGCYNLAGAISPLTAMRDRSRYQPGGLESREPLCADDRDNDGDGLIDSDDPNCLNNAHLEYDFNRTELGTACADGKDNDQDGHSDDKDIGCYDINAIAKFPGYRDLQGSSLNEFRQLVMRHPEWYQSARNTELGEPGCMNGKDDDGDGDFDDADVSCGWGSGSFNPFAQESDDNKNKPCSDEIDNDGDGKIDQNDPECTDLATGKYDPSRREVYGPACSNGSDDDQDGRSDGADAGCRLGGNPSGPYRARDTSETGEPRCSDGKDNNDKNGADASDPACHLGGNTDWPYIWFRSER